MSSIVAVEGSDRIALRSRTTGELLGKTVFDLTDWGGGAATLRAADTGRYLSLHGNRLLAKIDCPSPATTTRGPPSRPSSPPRSTASTTCA